MQWIIYIPLKTDSKHLDLLDLRAQATGAPCSTSHACQLSPVLSVPGSSFALSQSLSYILNDLIFPSLWGSAYWSTRGEVTAVGRPQNWLLRTSQDVPEPPESSLIYGLHHLLWNTESLPYFNIPQLVPSRYSQHSSKASHLEDL